MSAVGGSGLAATLATDDRCQRLVLSRHGAPLLQGYEATSFLARLRGLHALPVLGPCDALLIRPCRAVQMWRMPYAIDVAFLGPDGQVLALHHDRRGGTAICWKARVALEMAAGTARRLDLHVGQQLLIDGGIYR